MLACITAVSLTGYARTPDPAQQDWKHLMDITMEVSTDKEVQRSIDQLMVAFKNTMRLSFRKIARKSSVSQKQKLAALLHILNQLLVKYAAAIESGNIDALDEKTQEEINQLGQEMMILVLPALMTMQDPKTAHASEALLKDLRVKAFNGLRDTVAQLSKDLQ